MPDPAENNEPGKARKIIDHTQLHQITEKIFCRFPVFIIENNQKNPAKVLGYKHPHFEIMHSLPASDSRTLLLEKDDNSMVLECSVAKRTDRNTEILKPIRLFLTKRGVRHENRVAVTGSGQLAGIVQNCIPHTEFYKINAATNAGRDALLTNYRSALRELIPESAVKLELQKANRLSVRMKKLQDFNLPVFAPQMLQQRQGDELNLGAMPYSEYEQLMRSDGLPGDYMGEICEPIRYRGVLPVGYVQVLSTHAPLNLSQYHAVRQLTRRLENDMHSRGSFPQNPISGKIVDVSFGGIGFMYTTQRNVMSSVAKGDKIVFDAQFAPDNASTFSGKVMNISAQENAMRFGIEIENFTDEGRAAIDKVLDSRA